MTKEFYPAPATTKPSSQKGGNEEEEELVGFALFLRYLQFICELTGVFLYTFYLSLVFVYRKFSPVEPKSLKNGEIILVTGGGNGIGRELCLQLAKLRSSGLTIITWDIDAAANDKVVQELKDLGIHKAYGFKVDVSNRAEVEATAEKIRQEIGNVSILFNNAGVPGLPGNAWQIDPKVVQKVYEINVISHCWTLREFLPSMIEKGYGHVIETCSVLGFLAGRSGSPYIGAKHAVKGYTESVKEDLRFLPGKPDIKFSLVYPHNTLTDMTANINFKAGKYPFLMPHMTPKFVASEIITGFLRNEEHIYVPSNMRTTAMLLPLLPPKAVRRFTDMFDIQIDQ